MAQEDQSTARSTGKVNWFSDGKGYGFITPDDGGEELFVHQSSIISDGFRSLIVGESVEYAIMLGSDGKTKAIDVTAPGGGSVNKKEISSRGNGGECFSCGEVGHMAKDCVGGKNFISGGRKSGNEGCCYTCGDVGHFARYCMQNVGEKVEAAAGRVTVSERLVIWQRNVVVIPVETDTKVVVVRDAKCVEMLGMLLGFAGKTLVETSEVEAM